MGQLIETETLWGWINANDFDSQGHCKGCVVDHLNVEMVAGKQGKARPEYTLFFRINGFAMRKVSIWGEAMLKMVEKLGNDTENWIGKPFEIHQVEGSDGKRKKVFIP